MEVAGREFRLDVDVGGHVVGVALDGMMVLELPVQVGEVPAGGGILGGMAGLR